jgi:hypothetical protein
MIEKSAKFFERLLLLFLIGRRVRTSWDEASDKVLEGEKQLVRLGRQRISTKSRGKLPEDGCCNIEYFLLVKRQKASPSRQVLDKSAIVVSYTVSPIDWKRNDREPQTYWTRSVAGSIRP